VAGLLLRCRRVCFVLHIRRYSGPAVQQSACRRWRAPLSVVQVRQRVSLPRNIMTSSRATLQPVRQSGVKALPHMQPMRARLRSPLHMAQHLRRKAHVQRVPPSARIPNCRLHRARHGQRCVPLPPLLPPSSSVPTLHWHCCRLCHIPSFTIGIA
jgi:hypothetical protein